jgi:hypothetical protein
MVDCRSFFVIDDRSKKLNTATLTKLLSIIVGIKFDIKY